MLGESFSPRPGRPRTISSEVQNRDLLLKVLLSLQGQQRRRDYSNGKGIFKLETVFARSGKPVAFFKVGLMSEKYMNPWFVLTVVLMWYRENLVPVLV